MKSYPIISASNFIGDVKELERFVNSLEELYSECDMNDIDLDDTYNIFYKSLKFDYKAPIFIDQVLPGISIEYELLKFITAFMFDNKYNLDNLFIITLQGDEKHIFYVDFRAAKWNFYMIRREDDDAPYFAIRCENYTEIPINEDCETLKDVVNVLNNYIEKNYWECWDE